MEFKEKVEKILPRFWVEPLEKMLVKMFRTQIRDSKALEVFK